MIELSVKDMDVSTKYMNDICIMLNGAWKKKKSKVITKLALTPWHFTWITMECLCRTQKQPR